MVGKTNLPPDAEKRKDIRGSASSAPGLTPIDEERAASMADEGGTAGSAVESQERPTKEQRPTKEHRPRSPARRRGR